MSFILCCPLCQSVGLVIWEGSRNARKYSHPQAVIEGGANEHVELFITNWTLSCICLLDHVLVHPHKIKNWS